MVMTPLRLPIPPSVNALYGNRRGGKGKGRFKTAAYKAWLTQSDNWILIQWRKIKRLDSPYSVTVRVPKTRGDIDNRLKALVDYLVSRKIVPDDRHMRAVSVRVDPELDGKDYCEIEIEEASDNICLTS